MIAEFLFDESHSFCRDLFDVFIGQHLFDRKLNDGSFEPILFLDFLFAVTPALSVGAFIVMM